MYSILNDNILPRYYNVSNTWIEWSAMIYFIVYIPLLFPACWIMDKMGLRFVVICGAAGTFAGAWIKMFSFHPHQFYIGFIGQTIIAISQVFVLSLPSRVAAVWFGPNEVSTACSIGVFGNEVYYTPGRTKRFSKELFRFQAWSCTWVCTSNTVGEQS